MYKRQVLSRSDLGILSFLANSDLVAISRECLYANNLGDASLMERDDCLLYTSSDGVERAALGIAIEVGYET